MSTPSRKPTQPLEHVVTQDLPLPHERENAEGYAGQRPSPVVKQAKKDLDAGLVDTEMRGDAGVDDEQRRRLLKGDKSTSPRPDK
jgi:hypothetical protein